MEKSSTVRTAQFTDCKAIDDFLYRAAAVHRHLDWRTYNDWLGHPAFLLSLHDSAIQAMLICTAEPSEVFWIRIFAVDQMVNLRSEWQILFQAFRQKIQAQNESLTIASIAYFDWMKELLRENNWKVHQEIVQLRWNGLNLNKLDKKWPFELTIRPMTFHDLKTVTAIDELCFPFVWKQSYNVIQQAFTQSSYTTVAVINNEIVGFQISTSHKSIAHLARLAVDPKFQGQHIGQALVQNMLRHFSKPWIREITVNTQHDNTVSLNLYRKMSFELTGDRYPIYLYQEG